MRCFILESYILQTISNKSMCKIKLNIPRRAAQASD